MDGLGDNMVPLANSDAFHDKRPKTKIWPSYFSILYVVSQAYIGVFLLKPLETKLISETSSVCQAEQVARVIVKDAIVSKLSFLSKIIFLKSLIGETRLACNTGSRL